MKQLQWKGQRGAAAELRLHFRHYLCSLTPSHQSAEWRWHYQCTFLPHFPEFSQSPHLSWEMFSWASMYFALAQCINFTTLWILKIEQRENKQELTPRAKRLIHWVWGSLTSTAGVYSCPSICPGQYSHEQNISYCISHQLLLSHCWWDYKLPAGRQNNSFIPAQLLSVHALSGLLCNVWAKLDFEIISFGVQ